MSRKTVCGIRCKNNSLSIKTSCSVLTIILLIAFSMTAFAEVGPDSCAISPFAGGYSFDASRNLEQRPVYGLRPDCDYTKNWGVVAAAPVLPTTDPAAPAPEAQKPVLSWETGAGKSYIIPALEIIGFDFLLNRFNYHFIDEEVYGTTWSSIRDNLTGTWVVDTDPFSTNQFLHPYQGSIYFGAARSAGLNFWESLGYAFVGSFLWEVAGETGPPPSMTRSRPPSEGVSWASRYSGWPACCSRTVAASPGSGASWAQR